MERLTPGVQTAYPVERSIMDENKEGEIRPRVRNEKDTGSDRERKRSERGDAVGRVKRGDGIFSNFKPEQFSDNKSLEELAQMVKIAESRNEITPQFMQSISSQLFERVQYGLVPDNKARAFTTALNAAVVQAREKGMMRKAPDKTERLLAEELKDLIETRRREGITTDDVQSIRAILEKTFGRELTSFELQRAMFGVKSIDKSPQNKEFEVQIELFEKIASSPKRFEEFIRSADRMDSVTLKNSMSGITGQVAFEMLLGDVSDGREEYSERLGKILNGDNRNLKEGIKALVREIEAQEKKEMPKTNPEKAKAAKHQAEQVIKETRKKRDVSAEEAESIMRGVEISISGGSNYEEDAQGLLERLEELPDEYGNIFISARDLLLEDGLVNVMAEEMYRGDISKIQLERDKFDVLKEIDDPAVFKRRYKALMNDLVERWKKEMSDPDRLEELREARVHADEIARNGETVTKSGKTFGDVEHADYDFFNRKPKNVLDVAAWIVSSDDSRTWGPDGRYPIFTRHQTETIEVRKRDPRTGNIELMTVAKPVFQAENFIRWVRSKALEHHGDNPNDPINLLQSVNIETLFSPVSILTMKYNKQQYFSDHEGNLLNNLANEAINEAWLFGVRRNKNLGYIQSMNSDEKLFEAILEMSGKNDHTSSTNLADLLRMGEQFTDEEGNLDNKVGDAMLAMNQIYRNIADYKRLSQILPEDTPLFTYEGFENALRFVNKQDADELPKGFGNLVIDNDKRRIYFRDPRRGDFSDIFKDGKLVLKKDDKYAEISNEPAALIDFLNIFPAANPEETNEVVVRELVKQSVAHMVGYETGLEKDKFEDFVAEVNEKEKIDESTLDPDKRAKRIGNLRDYYRKTIRINLDWAEINSWSEQRWNGAAARNDTGYRGYDAWTKMYAQYYRERQSGPRTAGPIGNPEDMQIFRMLSPDMWLAIRTESGEAVQQVFDQIHEANLQLYKHPEGSNQRKEIQKKKDELYGKLRFPRWTESDWASNGIKRQSEVWHNMLNTEDIAFSEIVKRDNWGILRFDRAKFEEVVKDDFIKKRRYAFSSNNAINYGAIMRMRERIGIERGPDGSVKETFAFKDKYLAEAMFGEIVIGSIRADWYEGKLSFEAGNEQGIRVTKKAVGKIDKDKNEEEATLGDYLNSSAAREKILKNVVRAGLAAQLRAHRKFGSLDERWDNHAVRKFYAGIRSMPQYIEDPATGKEIRIDDQQFLTEEDIEWIRKHSGTTKRRLLAEDMGLISADILAGVLPGAFKAFWDDVTSDLAA